MTRTERFLMLVQTAVIIESIKGEPPPMTEYSSRATMTLSAAMRIPEHLLPNEESTCDTLIETVFYRRKPVPDWLVNAIAEGQ